MPISGRGVMRRWRSQKVVNPAPVSNGEFWKILLLLIFTAGFPPLALITFPIIFGGKR